MKILLPLMQPLIKVRGIIEKYNFALNNMGQYVYSGGSIIDTTGKKILRR